MRRLNFVDLFAGCGGLSLGLHNAGWSGVLAVEQDPDAFSTFAHNLINTDTRTVFDWPSNIPVQPHDVRTLLLRFRPQLRALAGRIDLVAGGPPCQGFSSAGRRKYDDPRNMLFHSYLEVVQLLRPRVVLVENVKGITVPFRLRKFKRDSLMNAGIDPDLSYSARIESELRTLGYVIYSRTLNASDFGVPQRRSRYFIIGLEEGLAKTSADPFDVLWGERTDFLKTKGLAAAERTSVRDAISDLETTGAVLRSSVDTPGYLQIEYSGPRTRYQKLMRDGLGTVAPDSLRLVKHREGTIEKLAYIIARCEPGRKVPKAVRAELGLSKHTLNLLCPTQPAATLTCLPDDMIHYNEPRILTVREYARLQSFPDSFAVLGRYTTGGQRRRTQSPRYTQIGNAVPPLLAEALGRALLVITNGRAA